MKTKEQYASAALWNVLTRANKYLESGDIESAIRVLRAGALTAERWMNGTHKLYRSHVVRKTIKIVAKKISA